MKKKVHNLARTVSLPDDLLLRIKGLTLSQTLNNAPYCEEISIERDGFEMRWIS